MVKYFCDLLSDPTQPMSTLNYSIWTEMKSQVFVQISHIYRRTR